MKPILISLMLSSILVACGPSSPAIPSPEEILTNCWGAKKIDNGNFRLQTSVVNMGKHGWKAGTASCGGIGLEIFPEPKTQGQLYRLQNKTLSSDAMGLSVFHVDFDARIVRQRKGGLDIKATKVHDYKLEHAAQACKIFETYSDQSICDIYIDEIKRPSKAN